MHASKYFLSFQLSFTCSLLHKKISIIRENVKRKENKEGKWKTRIFSHLHAFYEWMNCHWVFMSGVEKIDKWEKIYKSGSSWRNFSINCHDMKIINLEAIKIGFTAFIPRNYFRSRIFVTLSGSRERNFNLCAQALSHHPSLCLSNLILGMFLHFQANE